jgi:hypothetical protein
MLRIVSERQYSTGRAELDDVSTIFNNFAGLCSDTLDTIGYATTLMVKIERQIVLVRMSAGNAKGRSRRDNPRSGYVARINRVAKGDVRIAIGMEVANRRKPGEQCRAGISCAAKGFSRGGLGEA